jgi:hypothetical protein
MTCNHYSPEFVTARMREREAGHEPHCPHCRLAEAERLLRRVPYITPVKKLHQDIGEFLRTADSADDGLLADRVHKDGKLYRERR